MYEKGKNKMGKSLRLEIEDMWTPLREIQAEDAATKKANEDAGLGTKYAKWVSEWASERAHHIDGNVYFDVSPPSLPPRQPVS